MGVSIHYSGILTSPDVLPSLIEEMKALASEAGWKITKIAPDWFRLPNSPPLRVQGLLVSLYSRMEPLNLVFDESGRLTNFLHLVAFSDETATKEPTKIVVVDNDNLQVKEIDENSDPRQVALWNASTKTQFAGPAAHIALCKLLRYLQPKYFRHLEVRDEGDYWETGEVERLIERMNIINFATNQLSDFLVSRTKKTSSVAIDELLADLKEFCQQIQKQLPHRRFHE